MNRSGGRKWSLRTRRFRITPGGGFKTDCIEILSESNTGDPQILYSFCQWAIAKYPADRYALILWNHGSGWWKEARGRAVAPAAPAQANPESPADLGKAARPDRSTVSLRRGGWRASSGTDAAHRRQASFSPQPSPGPPQHLLRRHLRRRCLGQPRIALCPRRGLRPSGAEDRPSEHGRLSHEHGRGGLAAPGFRERHRRLGDRGALRRLALCRDPHPTCGQAPPGRHDLRPLDREELSRLLPRQGRDRYPVRPEPEPHHRCDREDRCPVGDRALRPSGIILDPCPLPAFPPLLGNALKRALIIRGVLTRTNEC